MLNKKGFMSMSLVYSFFIVFIAILVSLLVGYSKNNALLNNIKNDIKADINVGSSFITYYPNLAIIDASPVVNVAIPNTEYTISANSFVSASYTFLGWNTKTDGTGTNYSAGAKITANGNIDLYARWEVTKRDYFYTGAVQSFTVPYAGNYIVEAWGSQGSGNLTSGKGAYTSGMISLTAGEVLYIYVGGNTASFNGSGTNSFGGGATDVRLSGGVWDDTTGLRNRIMVAGGGGATLYDIASNAGGLIGYSGNADASGATCGEHVVSVSNGGTQTSGGSAGSLYENNCYYAQSLLKSSNVGSFGRGGEAVGGLNEYGQQWYCGGSGGSGYYGGGSGVCSHTINIAAAGGSSFISGHAGSNAVNATGVHTGQANHYSGKKFTSTKMIDGSGYSWTNVKSDLEQMPNPLGGYYSSGMGHSGTGHVRITFS